jgi:hypothetical protein
MRVGKAEAIGRQEGSMTDLKWWVLRLREADQSKDKAKVIQLAQRDDRIARWMRKEMAQSPHHVERGYETGMPVDMEAQATAEVDTVQGPGWNSVTSMPPVV